MEDLTSLLGDFDADEQPSKTDIDNRIYSKYEQEIAALSRDLGINLESGGSDDYNPSPPSQNSTPAMPQSTESDTPNFFQPEMPQFQPQMPSYQQPPPPQQMNYGFPPQPQQQNFYPYQQPQYTYAQPQKNYYEDDNKECEEDEKLHLLEKIKHMTEILEKTENGDISDLPTISKNHSISEIRDVHKMLIQKTNRIRYTELGQQLILNGARLLSHVFDGSNEFFGKKIDLRGLPTRIDYKLQYIKPQLADFVQRCCSNWDPMLLTGIELLAIIATHSYENASTIKKDNLFDEFEKGSSEMYKM